MRITCGCCIIRIYVYMYICMSACPIIKEKEDKANRGIKRCWLRSGISACDRAFELSGGGRRVSPPRRGDDRR